MRTVKFIIVSCVFFISACGLLSPKAEFIPENSRLKSAAVGVPYLSKIDIIGGPVMGGWYRQRPGYTPGIVTPSDAGIYLRNCLLSDENTDDSILSKEPRYNGNCIEVYGTPNKVVEIKINISGGMYGSMIAPASYFSKNYILNVVKP